MPSCELCGKKADKLTKSKIEGAVLKACDSCAEMGEKVQKSRSNKRKTTKKSYSKRKRKEEVLKPDYGKLVKKARDKKKLSISEVAKNLKEKESVIKRIEQGELKPDKALANKLEKEFSIELYTSPAVNDVNQNRGDTRKATLGDVADIKD